MNKSGAIWVGLLDFESEAPVIGVTGPVKEYHSEARIMVRLHGAPLGFIHVPTGTKETLTSRARAAASVTLAEPMRRHLESEKPFGGLPGTQDWMANAICPRNFPARGGPGVSVVICTRNRANALRACLEAFHHVNYTPLEILVVDNAPTNNETHEAVAAAAKNDPRIRYIFEPRAGLSRARNYGLSHSRFDIIGFTDDDTFVDPNWPAALAAGFAADPETVCVTGLVASSALETGCELYFDSRYSWGEVFEPRRYDLAEHRHQSRLYPFRAGIFGVGANFAVRRSVVARLGGFDPLLGAGSPGLGGEDLDMFLRIIMAGKRISYLPSALVWHKHRADTKALAEQIFSYGHGLGAYLAKHLSSRQLRTQILMKGLAEACAVASRMWQASHKSQLRSGGRRLALNEIRGVATGAWRYHRAVNADVKFLSGV